VRRWQIQHATRYTYAAPVRDSFNEVRLQPFSNEHQTVEAFQLCVTPNARVAKYHDFYFNAVHHFEIPEPHSELLVQTQMQVATHPKLSLALDARPASMCRVKEAQHGERAYDFIFESRFVDVSPETWHLAVDATQGEDDLWQCALRLMRFVHGHLKYQPSSTSVHTHMRQVLEQRRGVCQDFAHVMLGLCRTLKIPALYVSGYLATETASATHAWVEVLVPGVGWQSLDPTHNCIPDETYVKIGVGRDYADVPPVSGTYKGTTERTMNVQVQILRME
jgi:transglutaminase-like putative cysteine protease